ncbi:hypothetical protein OMP43_18470 [Sphingomonas sp. CBMAI 2297]|uniref:hypothetical protein n=1 Tax=Sphingomonas sp. CBMAI 2297 TaxID=2991720 RepID=UPI00245846F3|nr:hypothetical protein [Sphingomonas sp. CBMAI 2297]MDH4746015.1 hypothetical protein [Sphingomonas sp. CBMAI 2297]
MLRGDAGLSNLSRRALLAGAALLALPARARAAEDFAIDWQGGEQTPAIAASLAAQIALVKALRVSDAARDFFAAQVITVDLQPGTRTRAGPRGVFFARETQPAENPVLLHELIHRWQLLRMPGGQQNPDVLRFYREAQASGRWQAQAYMLTNPFEFFAMMASVVLHGTAARPPFRRENVKAKAPEPYAFIVKEFGLAV